MDDPSQYNTITYFDYGDAANWDQGPSLNPLPEQNDSSRFDDHDAVTDTETHPVRLDVDRESFQIQISVGDDVLFDLDGHTYTGQISTSSGGGEIEFHNMNLLDPANVVASKILVWSGGTGVRRVIFRGETGPEQIFGGVDVTMSDELIVGDPGGPAFNGNAMTGELMILDGATLVMSDPGLDTMLGQKGQNLFGSPANSGTLMISGQDSYASLNRIFVGGFFGGAKINEGIIEITDGGELDAAGDVRVGGGSGNGNSSVTVEASIMDVTGSLTIGEGTEATMTISDGGIVTVSVDGEIGIAGAIPGFDPPPNSNATITGAGSLWDVEGTLRIGAGSVGQEAFLNILDSGSVTSADGEIEGADTSNISIATVSGGSSSWELTGNLDVKDHAQLDVNLSGEVTGQALSVGTSTGQGFMNITSEGTVISTGGEIEGVSATSKSVVTISDMSSLWDVNGALQIKDGGQLDVDNQGTADVLQLLSVGNSTGRGFMNIMNAGVVISAGGEIEGVSATSKSVVTINDMSSLWDVNGALQIMDGGQLDVDNQGTADVEQLLSVGNSTGRGFMNIMNAGVVISASGEIEGISATSNSRVKIDDMSSLWDVNGALQIKDGGQLDVDLGTADVQTLLSVGTGGEGFLNVTGQGTVNSASGEIEGFDTGNEAIATISGASSNWDLTGNLDVKDHARLKVDQNGAVMAEALNVGTSTGGQGFMDIASAGTVTSTSGSIEGPSFGNESVVTINDALSLWDVDGALQIMDGGQLDVDNQGTAEVQALLSVGTGGEGFLNVTGQGTVISSASGEIEGFDTGNEAIATISGASSNWDLTGNLDVKDHARLKVNQNGAVTAEALNVGTSTGGQGFMDIASEGTVTSTSGSIEGVDGSESVVTVSGADSQWNLTGLLDVKSHGKLQITDNGTVTTEDYTQASTGELQLDVSDGMDPSPSIRSDILALSDAGTDNTLTLSGTLLYDNLGDAFTASPGAGKTIISGATTRTGMFTKIDGFEVDNTPLMATVLATHYAGNEVQVKFTVAGDANFDDTVGPQDYTLWANNFGAETTDYKRADFNGDNTVGPNDYTIWANNFGASTPSGPSGPSAVPEPSSLLLAAFGLMGLGLVRPRPRRKRA